MDIDKKKLLYDIVDWRMKEFYNRMNDHWSLESFAFNTKCINTIDKLESEYINTYGNLPEWDNIDDVKNTFNQLKTELMNMAEEDMCNVISNMDMYNCAKTIKITSTFLQYLKAKYIENYLCATHDHDVVQDQFMGIPVEVDDTIEGPYYEIVY